MVGVGAVDVFDSGLEMGGAGTAKGAACFSDAAVDDFVTGGIFELEVTAYAGFEGSGAKI